MPRPAVVGELNRSSRRQCGTSSSADGKWAASAIEQGMIPFGYRIALVHPIIKAFRQQRRLLAIRPLNETLHHPTPIQQGNHSIGGVFTQPGSQPDLPPLDRDVRFAALNGLNSDIAPCPKSANRRQVSVSSRT